MNSEYELYDLSVARFEVDELRIALNRAKLRQAKPTLSQFGAPIVTFLAGGILLAVGLQAVDGGTPIERMPILIGGFAAMFGVFAAYVQFAAVKAIPAEIAGIEDRLDYAVTRVAAIIEVELERDAAAAAAVHAVSTAIG
jgi:hypothetical protein